MRTSKILGFLFQSIFVGLLAALLLYAFKPELFETKMEELNVREAVSNLPSLPAIPSLGNGPVSYADAVEGAAPAVVNIYTAKGTRTDQLPVQRPVVPVLLRRTF